MAQFIPVFHLTFHLCTLFIFLMLLIHYRQVSAYNVYRVNSYSPQSLPFDDNSDNSLNMFSESDEPIDDEFSLPNPFVNRLYSSYYRPSPTFKLRHGIAQIAPYKKRTIPLELQKALYAHGIVGRRR
ncbi:unnamed protein product [Adineta ricciae]|uniref:Uncharacterized protein n=1 Tax=Adineta ricciae TaxID=249248 RepID=A0A813QVQ7_ADIRI|nr:unnamed protein product [Adineta ricciae]CAF0945976.1 unnamed protein product [Adineta ricciae]